MHKITKKLFGYFTALAAFFAVTAFFGFLGVFRYFTYQHLENDLKARAGAIKDQLEQFMDQQGATHGQGQGRGAYLRFVNDIAMADAYILDEQGNPFTYGKNGTAGNMPTEDVLQFSTRIFTSGSYEHVRQKEAGGDSVFYVGVPVCNQDQVILAVIIRDTADVRQDGFLLAVTILFGCMLLALVLSGLLSAFLSRRFIRPIQQIAFTTKELARGNYLVRTDVKDNTELGELAEQTDLLADKLEAARQESTKLEQMQKDYISNISHELRTPVTVIRSSLEALCDGVVRGEKAMEYERQMLAECISLQRLVNDMLELSRLQNQEFPIEKESMELTMALEDAIRTVRVLAKNKSITIRFEKDPEGFFMEGDYGRLRQMFVAALDNAIKYSAQDTQIEVQTSNQADFFIVSMQDHGCGIPAQDLEHIFERFYRSGQKHVKGSGLGLAIMKSIGDRHHIQIRLKSEDQQGTRICFYVPKAESKKAV